MTEFEIVERPKSRSANDVIAVAETFDTGKAVRFKTREDALAARNRVYQYLYNRKMNDRSVRQKECEVWVEAKQS